MKSQVGIINNGSDVYWDWSNVTVPCAEDRASAGSYHGDKVSELATEYQMDLPSIIETLVNDINNCVIIEKGVGCDKKELTSLVCSDFRNVLDSLREKPYRIVAICEALGIESNIKG